jgi:hypothetical protein
MGHPSICCWGAFIQLCAHRMNQEAGGKSSGIPHLAKNERDVGHPSFVGERKVDPLPNGSIVRHGFFSALRKSSTASMVKGPLHSRTTCPHPGMMANSPSGNRR